MEPDLALTRRVLLRRSLQIAGAAAAAPAFVAACVRGDGTGDDAAAVFDASARRTLASVADAFVPRGGAFPLGAIDVDLAGRIERYVATSAPDLEGALRGALLVVEWASPLLAGRFARFSSLDLDARTSCLEALLHSRLALARDAFVGLKQLVTFQFYAVDEVFPSVGYEGPWVQRRPRSAP